MIHAFIKDYFCNVDTSFLQNCTVTSPTTGTIRVSCDSSHQIAVIVTCTNCNNPNMVTSSGNSPLIVRELDPGVMYSVMINVFDGNQVIITNQTVTTTITVKSNKSGEMSAHGNAYICKYVHTLMFIFN